MLNKTIVGKTTNVSLHNMAECYSVLGICLTSICLLWSPRVCQGPPKETSRHNWCGTFMSTACYAPASNTGQRYAEAWPYNSNFKSNEPRQRTKSTGICSESRDKALVCTAAENPSQLLSYLLEAVNIQCCMKVYTALCDSQDVLLQNMFKVLA